ncbi:Rv3235 family protein [Nesterenkonia massiliensis]|uniref:Rv3235 family protein n=1 Tax=Nesterenkonia massiliensis TaxID=1232429 RepID=A0ABT2HM67_9MICC|nr:Rv3235 family protein [Nesterenkonia massiliensis]MCT1605774.1 Rv3235 family protein [Nesterenkonia massiliensis]
MPLNAAQSQPSSSSATLPALLQQPPSRRPSRFRLQREDEVPRLLHAMGARELNATSELRPDGRAPVPLASEREEQRQITAISRMVCQAMAETFAGLRPVHQMQRWLDGEIYQKVSRRAALLARHRQRFSPGQHRNGPAQLVFRSIRTQQVSPSAWEVCVIFTDDQRTRACALRCEAHRARWRITALELG